MVSPKISSNSVVVKNTPLQVEKGRVSINSTDEFNTLSKRDNTTPKNPEITGINEVISTNIPVYIIKVANGIAIRFVTRNKKGNR
jgi:hypothetical protein